MGSVTVEPLAGGASDDKRLRGDDEEPILRTEALTVRFGGLTALNHVDFAVRRDEIRAVIGPNGAGKSTFFNCLTGVRHPSSGRILFNGEDITGLPPNRISQKGIARSYQITNILPNATALENVRIAAQSRDRKSTRLNSSHLGISYAVFCLKKKKKKITQTYQLAR